MDQMDSVTTSCCAECGVAGGVSLKACKACMLVRYCNANCQRNHWQKHKKDCKLRAAELRDEALFKDPPPKEDCPICFLPMPAMLICCASLPSATISSVPIDDFAMAIEGVASLATDQYYSCCGKNVCGGCLYSFHKSGNMGTCPFCRAKNVPTDVETIQEMMKRVEANDAGAIYVLGCYHYHGQYGLHQDEKKATELWTQAAKLGSKQAHYPLGNMYFEGGDLKKAKFHYEAAAMAGHEEARYNLGSIEGNSGNMEQAVKHWTIAASAGQFTAMRKLQIEFEKGYVSRDTINSSLTAYNNSCAEMRSEARDAHIRMFMFDN